MTANFARLGGRQALDDPAEDGSVLVFLRLDGTLSKRIRRVITWLNDCVRAGGY